MARRSGNLKREDIKEELVLIDGSLTDYITPSGKVYKLYYNGLYMEKKSQPNINNGYVMVKTKTIGFIDWWLKHLFQTHMATMLLVTRTM